MLGRNVVPYHRHQLQRSAGPQDAAGGVWQPAACAAAKQQVCGRRAERLSVDATAVVHLSHPYA